MDGFEACKKIRKDKRYKDIPIIFLTAYTDKENVLKGFELGGQDYITKPFNTLELLARVKTHLKLRSFQKALEEKNESLLKALHELAETQNQLIQSAKMASLGVLTAGIAHEINNPVNAINSSSISLNRLLGKIFLLLEYYEDISIQNVSHQIDKINRYKEEIEFEDAMAGIKILINNIKNGVSRTTEIVDGLKTFTNFNQAEKKLTDIHENLDNTLQLAHHKIKYNIHIKKDYGNIPKIECYPGKLNQVFMNLLINAIDSINSKKTEKGQDEIRIKTSIIKKGGGEYLEISISDTGKGIPDDIKKRIFEPFFTTKGIGEGTGLGLSITHGIIENHLGSIEVESEIGAGSTFTIQLPI